MGRDPAVGVEAASWEAPAVACSGVDALSCFTGWSPLPFFGAGGFFGGILVDAIVCPFGGCACESEGEM